MDARKLTKSERLDLIRALRHPSKSKDRPHQRPLGADDSVRSPPPLSRYIGTVLPRGPHRSLPNATERAFDEVPLGTLSPPPQHVPRPLASSLPQAETTNLRAEAKRWCFTLNNPTLGDVFSPEHAVDPSLYDYLVCGNEVGASGTKHLQGFIIFKEKMRLSALKNTVFHRAHWSISRDKKLTRASNYCKKGDQSKEEWDQFHEEGPNYGRNADFVEFGTLPSPASKTASKERDAGFAAALDAPDVKAAMAVLSERQPKEYIIHRSAIQKNLTAHFHIPAKYKPRYALEQFCTPPLNFSDKHATLVWGDTNLGKTAFVKAHFKNPLFIRHMDRLREFSPENDAIIFDDMSFQHLPISTVIYLLDTDDDADIHVRYGVAKIPANTVKVFTHNTPNPFYATTADASQIAAVERRYKSFHVANKLFK